MKGTLRSSWSLCLRPDISLGRVSQPAYILQKRKNRLVPDAEISAAEMVLGKEFTSRAETAYLPHFRCRGGSSTAEESGGLVFFLGMTPPFSPLQNRSSFAFDITKHYLAHIMGDLPSKRVY